MVTRINADNVKKYSVLFNKANAKLGTEISSLNEYFGHLRQLIDAVTEDEIIEYVKLPLDEEYLSIDANSRRISIPQNFTRNGIGVIGDHTAEIVYFAIDRFFDAIDLGGNDVSIVIQWEGPNNTSGLSRNYGKMIDNMTADGNLQSLMTESEFQQVSSIQQKLIFGWPIDNRMTTAPGRIRFAVHFLKRDSGNNLSYAFNTLPAELVVNQTLVMDSEDAAIDLTDNLFARITSDGIYSLGSDIPSYPRIIYPLKAVQVYRKNAGAGDYDFDITNIDAFTLNNDSEGDYDLVDSGAIFNDGITLNLQNDDIVVLKTQAIAEQGDIAYEWKHEDDYLTDGKYKYTQVARDNNGLDITTLNEYFYQKADNKYVSFPYVGHFTFNAGENTITFNEVEYTLYTRALNNTPEAGTARVKYELVSGANIEEGHIYYNKVGNEYIIIEDNSTIGSSDTVYEPFAIYILEYSDENGDAIGKYTADIACFNGINTKVNKGNNKVEIPGPKAPEVQDNETANAEYDADEKVYHVLLSSESATLQIKDNSNNTNEYTHNISYQWKSSDDNLTFTDIVSATASSYDISSSVDTFDKYYKCEVTSEKHGKSLSADSEFVYRVTQPAAAPAFDITGDIDRELDLVGSMSNISLTVSVPLTDNTNGLPYYLIKENIDTTSETAGAYHILTLTSNEITSMGITPVSDSVRTATVLTSSVDEIVKRERIANGGTLTFTKSDFQAIPGHYRVLVTNTVNGDTNYSVSGVIHITQG